MREAFNTGTVKSENPSAVLERPAVVALLLALAACVLISRCWDAPFYLLDDRDQSLPGLEQNISELFRAPRPGCFPVTSISFKLDYLLFGTQKDIPVRKAFDSAESRPWAAGSRVLNAFYHFLAALALYWLLLRLNCGKLLALFVALAWTVHPISCELVCWIAERKSILVALFGFLAMVAWTFQGKVWRWPLVAFFFLLSVFCKGSALGFLPVFVALDFLLSEKKWRESRFWLERAAHMIVPTLIFILGVWFARRVYPYDMIVDPPGGTVCTAILSDVVIGAHYIFNTLAPVNLSFYYAFDPVVSLADLRLWACLFAVLAGGAALIGVSQPSRRALTIFGMVWFVGAVAPNCNIIAQSFPIQDRFIYLSIPGLLLAMGCACEGATERLKLNAQRRIIAAATFILILGLLAEVRSGVYVSERLLAMDAAQRYPTSGYAQLRAGLAYKNMAFESMPGGPSADPNLAGIYASLAEKHLVAAAECADIGYFSNKFELRTTQSQLELVLGNFGKVHELLTGWLPPPDMTMLPDNPQEARAMGYKRTASTPFYRKDTLRLAWSILGELGLRESGLPGLPLDQQAARCNEGLDAVTKGLDLKADDTALVLKARLLLRLAHIEAGQQQLDKGRLHFDEGAAILKSLPADSSMAPAARTLLEKVPRP